MSTNACYGCCVFFLNNVQQKTCFACGREGGSIHNFNMDLWFGEIQYESCTRIVNQLSIVEF